MSYVTTSISTASTPAELVGAVSQLVREKDRLSRFGSFSISIYDTAWLSMISKEDNGQSSWLFPKSFDYVLQSQQNDGTWEAYASPTDGILNTLASTLTLLIHANSSVGQTEGHCDRAELCRRILKARKGLGSLLQQWIVEDHTQVGSEILIPSLLRQVGKYGVQFEFPGRAQLEDLQAKKMKSFKSEIVYTEQATTIIHSLEALVDIIEFDKVSHHCSERIGMLGSPAATAAYLMNASIWDDRAESYLRTAAVEYGNCGGVPSAFPTCLFEISWALSILLFQILELKDLEATVVDTLSSFFKEVLSAQKGIVGFAPGVLGDADDTARALLTLRRLGKETDVGPMVKKFRSSQHFKTYEIECDPSFSANCNVLLALLHSSSVDEHCTLIGHTVRFLLSQSALKKSDKWNLSPYYSQMLFSDVLVSLLEKRNEGHLQYLDTSVAQHEIPISLCQIVAKLLISQYEDGSWSPHIEETSYCVLMLARCLSLPWEANTRQRIAASHGRGLRFLSEVGDQYPRHLWVEKVTYSSSVLWKTYYLSALKFPVDPEVRYSWREDIQGLFAASKRYPHAMHLMFCEVSFIKESAPEIGLASIESSRFEERLQEVRRMVFPREKMPMTEDRYLSYIPVIWTICNQVGTNVVSPEVLWEMILLSMLNYQVDEYMETVVPYLPLSDLNALIYHLRKACGLSLVHHRSFTPSDEYAGCAGTLNLSSFPINLDGSTGGSADKLAARSDVLAVMENYIEFVLRNPAVLRGSLMTQKELGTEVYDFLIAHIIQNIDNMVLKAWKNPDHKLPKTFPEYSQSSYFKWVQGTATSNTSCPFSFQFFVLLNCDAGKSFFDEPRANYLGQSLARHLATMCRQYNDYGSASRDSEESNLNSLDFPDFHPVPMPVSEVADHMQHDRLSDGERGKTGDASLERLQQKMKDELLDLAQFERAQMEMAFRELEKVMAPRKMQALRMFINVTDLFGQVYVQKDIASRVTTSKI